MKAKLVARWTFTPGLAWIYYIYGGENAVQKRRAALVRSKGRGGMNGRTADGGVLCRGGSINNEPRAQRNFAHYQKVRARVNDAHRALEIITLYY